MLLTRLTVVVAATSLAAVGLLSPAQADHSWGSYHWARTANPVPLVVGNNVTAAWAAEYTRSLTDWDRSKVLALTEGVPTGAQRCSAVGGTLQVCNGAYGRNGWLGLATISIADRTHITRATARVNDTYFATAKYNDADLKQDVLCQEIGHAFGLDHTSTDGTSQRTCMDYSTVADVTAPNAHDYAQLAEIYESHLDSSTTVAAASSGTSPSVGDDRSTWGREVARSKDGKHSTFVRDFGGGRLVLTDVRWA